MINQGTEEWFNARLGKVTASRLNDALATTKTGEGAGRISYRLELVTERLTGQKTESYTNSYMQWGTEQEPFAREAYEALKSEFVVETGFHDHPSIPMSGASPDGLIGEDGLIEIKCPSSTTHISYLADGKVPAKYKKQMMWQMACTGRKWVDFVSFDPRLPENLRLFVVRFEPTAQEIAEVEAQVVDFLATVDELETKLRGI
jgi:putative phage-type endonuclease